MSISTSCSSHVPFERSGHTWTKFHTRSNHQCNLWKRKKMPVAHKLSEASRLNSLFCLCLIPKLSKSMAQPPCCCRLKQAEINGILASRCVWRPPSPHEIVLLSHEWCPSPLPALHMFLLKDLVILEPSSTLGATISATYENGKNAGLTQVIWSVETKQPFLSLSDSQALKINGGTTLLLQAETGWDKWHCG